MKKIILLPLLSVTLSFGTCFPYTCDLSIIYAMTKERDAIDARVTDMINTLRAISQKTDTNNALMTKEAMEFIRTRQRYRIRLLDSKEQSYQLETLEKTIDLGVALQAVKDKVILNKKQNN